ncbi:MAG: GAF domain-containing protein [Actinobacteria bacterium]|nr:GAF domain-containing protein [Actinomycetota bacterium]
MSTTTLAPAEGQFEDQSAYKEAMAAFSEIAAGLNDELPLDALLHLLCEKLCRLLEIERCSLYLKDAETGLFRGRVAHYKVDVDDVIQRYVAGVPADGLTREILETKEAVLIADAQHDPRPVRSQMRRWGVRSMFGVPMIARGEVIGLAFLDNAADPYPYTRAQRELAQVFANLGASAIVQAEGRAKLRANLSMITRQNELLRRLSSANDRLTSIVLEGASGLDAIARAIAELAGNPCVILDGAGHRIAEGGGEHPTSPLDPERRDHPQVGRELAKLADKRVVMLAPVAAAGLPRRVIVAKVSARGEAWGHLVIEERRQALGTLEMATAERAATAIALELDALRRGSELELDLRRALVSELVRGGEDTTALERRSRRLGVDVYAPHAVIVLAARDRSARPPTATALAAALAAGTAAGLGEVPVLGAEVEDAITLVVEVGDASRGEELATALGAAVADLDAEAELLAGISTVCLGPGDYPRAHFEASQIIGLLREHSRATAAGMRVLSSEQLGASRFLFASHDREQLDGFLRDVLGGLLDEDEAKVAPLLETIACYTRTGSSTGRTAAALGIHENSVRNRLARIAELTGRDPVGDGEARLQLQLAEQALRLRAELASEGAVAVA